ncbi:MULTISPECIES: hypothetical protein [unclassified Pseudomonas]|uniref:hypothetical protein n=1 Tax=unclassified Pseudomonas TaxID=196821 RepID=UPI00244BCC48|nr:MULTISPECIES: hypothetical protein [unclassified Pseudomonas]MDH0895216.1 hypothetical protein [Pseudomonas sp. GD03875]MDH1064547.1 hypothetical protein [Pseudomonas sp. GD03985]
MAALGSSASEELLQANERQQPQRLWQAAPRQALQGLSLDLAPPPQTSKSAPKVLTSDASALVLQMVVSFTEEPDGAYEVLITDSQGGERLAGYLTFFGAAHHASSHGGAELSHADHSAAPARLKSSFLFDVTDELPADGQYGLRVKSQGDRSDEIRIDDVSLLRY